MFGFNRKKYVEPSILDRADMALHETLIIPFSGVPLPFVLRKPELFEIISVGNFSVFGDSKQNDLTIEQLRDYAKIQSKMAEIVLVAPTYDQIYEVAGARVARDSIKARIRELVDSVVLNESDKDLERAVKKEIAVLQMRLEYSLPNDFLSFVFSWAIGNDREKITALSKDLIVEAAILAEKAHKSVSDYIGGSFSAFTRYDLDRYAALLLYEFRKKK